MGEKVAADVEGLRRLRQDIERAQQTINAALSQLRSSLARANWDDAARRTFEDQLNDTMNSLRQFDTKAEALKPLLHKKIEALTAYLHQ